MTEKERPFVTVIIPCRNEEAFIERTVGSILKSDYPKDKMEIFVVDGMSDDRTREIIENMRRKDQRVKLLDNIGRVVPHALNIGIKASKADLFTIVGGHAEVPTDFIKNSVDTLFANPEAWIVGGYIENVADGYVANAIAGAMRSPCGVGNAMFRLGDYEGWVETLAFGMHHRWVIDKIGYFDETLVRNQDDDFNARILLGGGKIWMSKSIRSKYYTRSSLKNLWRQYYQYGFWRIRTIQKHKKPASLRQLLPLLLVSSFIVLGGLSFIHVWIYYLFILEVGGYAFGLILGACDVARKTGVQYAPLVPFIFLILHFGYGLGMIWGIVRFIIFKGKGLAKPAEFKLSR